MLSFCHSALSCVCLFSFKEHCAWVRAPSVGGGVYFLHQSVRSLHTVGKKSALLHAQGKENRTKCVSTVPTTAFCLQ